MDPIAPLEAVEAVDAVDLCTAAPAPDVPALITVARIDTGYEREPCQRDVTCLSIAAAAAAQDLRLFTREWRPERRR
jgi:hypothetical protein